MQLKVRSRIIPYVLATTIAVGSAVTGLKAQNDRLIKEGDRVELQNKNMEESSDNSNRRWINLIEIGGLMVLVGIFKLANFIDKKEAKEAENSDAKTTDKTNN